MVIICNSGDNTLGLARLNGKTGHLGDIEMMPFPGVSGRSGACPLATSPDRRMLYLAFRGSPPRVLSFRIDYEASRLEYLSHNALPDSMVHISADKTGRKLFSASYGGGIFAINDIGADGVVGETTQICEAEPKAHCTVVAPDNRYVFVPCIDADAVVQFDFDVAAGVATRANEPAAKVVAGAGPRHLVLHPNGKFAYLVNEMNGTVVVFSYGEEGDFLALQTVDISPSEFSGTPSAADIHLTPDGRFLYASDRGSNTIAAYIVDGETGELKEIGKTSVADTPRGFNIDQTGLWLLAAAEAVGTVSVFAIHPETGRLEKRQECATGEGPNWVEILPVPNNT